ncbi:PilW family protein [Candidatus Xianfuyuplasma coldseepsis]|uniref:Prepilin-type N-terminal cleavage/methylation domain-containing protein n=1 Tax=Candidatus Xianfuyuplasma coldseepsis TaxID=2782163 RepID=A0A7L7KUG4_9MOLU|nr:prepilin-type N-terminal cleavage/methylation domain-containing protein [Xianfuyuplasma coldseepsis]QMS85932.1 prepilin-type N-terminal cleavage/methylation domain-containing protein [Xianfuyuplasma coldseepsis]
MKKQLTKANKRQAGLTIIELLIAMAIGSIVLMMLMQLIVMNVTVRREYEYENFVTNQSLLISDVIRKNLASLQPHRFEVTDDGTTVTVSFFHEYDWTLNAGALDFDVSTAETEYLYLDRTAQTITYEYANGSTTVLHATNLKVLTASDITPTYYENVSPDPATCTDVYAARADRICGDGYIELELSLAVELNGILQEVYDFTTRIII